MSLVNVDRSQSVMKNLEVLQRLDPKIMEILGKTTHVAVYVFENNEWKRKEVEGSLFIVKRFDAPRFQLIVMNRLSTDNLVQNIDQTFRMELLEPYLILRVTEAGKKAPAIYGIWFFTESDRGKIHNLLERISKTQQRGALATSTDDRQSTPAKSRPVEKQQQPPPPQQMKQVPHQARPPTSSGHDSVARSVAIEPSSAGLAILGMLGQLPSSRSVAATAPPTPVESSSSSPPRRVPSQTLLTPSNVVLPNRARSLSNASSTGSNLLTPATLAPTPTGVNNLSSASPKQQSISKEHLKLALISLLQQDDEFLDKIHRAYVSRLHI